MTATPRLYLDTSAYLAVLLGERGASAVLKALGSGIPCSSTLILLETERNLVRLVREKSLSQRGFDIAFERLRTDRELFFLRDLSPDLCLSGRFPPTRTPRSADLVHLRTATWFQDNGGIKRFLSLDKEQLKAADELGLPV